MYSRDLRFDRPRASLAIALALTTFACDAPRVEPERSAAAPERAPRIASLSPELTQWLVDLELGAQLVGVDSESRRRLGLDAGIDLGEISRVDAAAIAGRTPDYALAIGAAISAETAAALRKRGISVHVFQPTTANAVLQTIHELGALLGREDRARAATLELMREVSAIATLRDGSTRLRVVWVLAREPLTIVGNRGLLHQLLELAGGEMALHQLEGERVEASLSALAASEPDVVLDSSPESAGDPIAIGARNEALPPEVGELPTLDLLARVRALHAILYPQH